MSIKKGMSAKNTVMVFLKISKPRAWGRCRVSRVSNMVTSLIPGKANSQIAKASSKNDKACSWSWWLPRAQKVADKSMKHQTSGLVTARTQRRVKTRSQRGPESFYVEDFWAHQIFTWRSRIETGHNMLEGRITLAVNSKGLRPLSSDIRNLPLPPLAPFLWRSR